MTPDEYSNTCEKYQDLLFAMSRESVLTTNGNGHLCFPPKYSNEFEPLVRAFLEEMSDNIRGVFVCNYDAKKHLELLNIDVEQVKRTLKINEIADYSKRIIWFHPNGAVINVRISQDKDAESLEKEYLHCTSDIKLLKYIFQDKLKNLLLTFTVVARNANTQLRKDLCSMCIKHTILQGEDIIKIENCIDETFLPDEPGDIVSNYKHVISRMVASVYTARIQTRESFYLYWKEILRINWIL